MMIEDAERRADCESIRWETATLMARLCRMLCAVTDEKRVLHALAFARQAAELADDVVVHLERLAAIRSDATVF